MKNLIAIIIGAVCWLAVVGGASAVDVDCTSGTVTATVEAPKGYTVWTINWTSDAGGYVITKGTKLAYSGIIERVITKPSGAPNAPTSYGLSIKDTNGIDLLYGVCTSRSTSVSEALGYIPPTSSIFSTSTLVQTVNTTSKFYPWFTPNTGAVTLNITGAGNTKKGTVIVYIRSNP